MNLRLRALSLNRSPDNGDIAGGGGGMGAGDAGAGAGAGGSAAGAANPGAAGGAQGGGAPARDYGRDIDSLRNEFSGFGKKFDSFHTDFQSRFPAPAQNRGGQGGKEPSLEDFNNGATQKDVLAFIDARSKFLARQEYTSLQEEGKKTQSAQDAKVKRSADIQAHVGRIGEAVSRYKDFDQVVNNAAMQLPDNVLDDVLESPFSADLQYHLSKNAGDLYKIVNAYNQSERQGAKMLGALEHRFELEAAARKAAQKKTRFGATENIDVEAGGNAGEDEEIESIAREGFRLKKKK